MRLACLIALALASAIPSAAQSATAPPARYATTTVVPEGRVAFGYDAAVYRIQGLRDGSQSVSTREVLGPAYGYALAPRRHPMQVHTLTVAYGAPRGLSVAVSLPLVRQEQTILTDDGSEFAVQSSGVGDFSIAVRALVMPLGPARVRVGGALSFPSGSIDETDVTLASRPVEEPLTYGMQLGSGTLDFAPEATVVGTRGRLGWGARAAATLRLGQNRSDYRLGHRASASLWGAFALLPGLSATVRTQAETQGRISGADPALARAATGQQAPNALADLHGGTALDLGGGFAMSLSPSERGLRFSMEGLWRLAQHLNGPQLQHEWHAYASLTHGF